MIDHTKLQLGKSRSVIIQPAPFGSESRPVFARALDALAERTGAIIDRKTEIKADKMLSAAGQASQVAAMKAGAMDQLGQAAQAKAEARNNLQAARERVYRAEKAASPYDLARAREIRDNWRAMTMQDRLAIAKDMIYAPAEFAHVLEALHDNPWPLDNKGPAADLIQQAFRSLCESREPELLARIEAEQKAFDWAERVTAQVSAILRAELEVSDSDLLQHYIAKDDRATLQALEFERKTIEQAVIAAERAA
jgi:hypothetical protein